MISTHPPLCLRTISFPFLGLFMLLLLLLLSFSALFVHHVNGFDDPRRFFNIPVRRHNYRRASLLFLLPCLASTTILANEGGSRPLYHPTFLVNRYSPISSSRARLRLPLLYSSAVLLMLTLYLLFGGDERPLLD